MARTRTHTHMHTHHYCIWHTVEGSHPQFEVLPYLLLQASHLGHVIAGGREETQLQLLWLGHHLAEQLIVGENWSSCERAVVLNALSSHWQLRGREREREGGVGHLLCSVYMYTCTVLLKVYTVHVHVHCTCSFYGTCSFYIHVHVHVYSTCTHAYT